MSTLSHMAPGKAATLDVAGRQVAVTNPDKVFFPELQLTKLDLVQYYVAVAEPALRAIAGRPMALKRYVNGIHEAFFFQKRAPTSRPDWVDVVELRFPSGRTACEIVVNDAAQLAWIINLGCVDLNPHPVRARDLEHPDELRIDLDPTPGVAFEDVRRVALAARDVLEEHGLTGYPKTSGSRGMHINVRIEPLWGFDEVRRAALALAREVEARLPKTATTKWWKEERRGVFIDYNQNAKDRTVASAYSVRPNERAKVSAPLFWHEVADCDPDDFTLLTMPSRVRQLGDPTTDIDTSSGSLESLLELSARQAEHGQGDAAWPPHYTKKKGEPRRVAPSRARRRSLNRSKGA